MPFLMLFVLTLTCLQRQWPPPAEWLGETGALLLTWGVVALFSLVAWLATRWWDHRLRRDASARFLILRRYSRFRRWHAGLLLVAYVLLVCIWGWGWFVGEICVYGEIVAPGTDLILLSPLFVGLTLSWACYHPLERALAGAGFPSSADSFPSRWSYIALQSRQSFLLLAPPLVLMFSQQTIIALFPSLLYNAMVLPLVGMCLLGLMYVGIPLLLRLLLGLSSLPDGPLRQRLLLTATRLSFRCSDIVVWNTRYSVANAMVTGPLPQLRYVILTDRLIQELSPEEVEAVFGHEVGHIKHHHLLFYFAFLLASLVAVAGIWHILAEGLVQSGAQAWIDDYLPALKNWLATYEVLSALPLLAFLAAYIVLVFGFLSRRCERQADIFGCKTVSVPVFIEALEKVARLNGICRDRPGWLQSWQHSTIARRISFLQSMNADPDLEPRFQRRLGLVKWGTLAALAVFTAFLFAFEPANLWLALGMWWN